MSRRDKISTWKGPEGWHGEAVRDFRRFSFSRLPWAWIKHEGQCALGAECVKSSNSRRVFRVDLDEFTQGKLTGIAYAKRYLANNWRRQLGNRLIGPRAGQEFRLGRELLDLGVATPEPLAWAAHLSPFPTTARDRPVVMPPASYLLTREWPNEGSLRLWLGRQAAAQETVVTRLAEFLARTHGLGFYHDDCSSEHILIRRAGSGDALDFCFIDVDNGRLLGAPLPERLRVVNLFQILRSLPQTRLTPGQRVAFLERYLEASARNPDDTLEALIGGIEKTAMRKTGRKVVRP